MPLSIANIIHSIAEFFGLIAEFLGVIGIGLVFVLAFGAYLIGEFLGLGKID